MDAVPSRATIGEMGILPKSTRSSRDKGPEAGVSIAIGKKGCCPPFIHFLIIYIVYDGGVYSHMPMQKGCRLLHLELCVERVWSTQ